MKSKLVADNAGERTYVLVLDPGEEAFKTLSTFADEEGLSAASLGALGAFSRSAGSTSTPRHTGKSPSRSNARY